MLSQILTGPLPISHWFACIPRQLIIFYIFFPSSQCRAAINCLLVKHPHTFWLTGYKEINDKLFSPVPDLWNTLNTQPGMCIIVSICVEHGTFSLCCTLYCLTSHSFLQLQCRLWFSVLFLCHVYLCFSFNLRYQYHRLFVAYSKCFDICLLWITLQVVSINASSSE